jgi:superfamily I DNA/RNA helicase
VEEKLHKLTEEQQEAFNKIINFLNDPNQRLFLLSGFAGTGKTFLIIRLVEHLCSDISNRILICATTNKSVKVLRKEIKQLYLNANFSTIHSALGLREHIDGYGKISFRPDKLMKNKVSGTNILFIDESSMLDDQLFYFLLSELNSNKKLKIIFCGDEAQIPPINKLDSIPFSKENQKKYNIGVTKLNNIIRQEDGHPIIELSDFVRKNLLEQNIFNKFERGKIESKNGTVYFLEFKEDQDRLILLLEELFCSENFKQDADHVKILSWTNATVNMYNDLIRSMIFGENLPKIVKGEKLILDSPWVVNKKVVFATNEELEVIDYTIRKLSIPGYPAMKYYDCKVFVEIDGKKIKSDIKIMHEQSEKLYNTHLNNLLKLAKKEKQGTFKAANAWKAFYHFQEIFAHVKFNYCLTAHKSQGSTYNNCFIILEDVEKNKKIAEKNRILYTSITRPKNNLFIIR